VVVLRPILLFALARGSQMSTNSGTRNTAVAPPLSGCPAVRPCRFVEQLDAACDALRESRLARRMTATTFEHLEGPRLNRNQRAIAESAARRSWSYAAGPNDEFCGRWRWNPKEPGVHHRGGYRNPFGGTGPRRGVGSLFEHTVSGATPAGRPFWAFLYRYPISDHGVIPRTVSFIYTARQLPTVSVVPRTTTEQVSSWFGGRIARANERSEDPRRRDAVERLAGLQFGSAEFQQQFQAEALDHAAAEWLLTPEIQRSLLADGGLSLASKDADVLCWGDRGDFDLDTVDAMLQLLDRVVLP